MKSGLPITKRKTTAGAGPAAVARSVRSIPRSHIGSIRKPGTSGTRGDTTQSSGNTTQTSRSGGMISPLDMLSIKQQRCVPSGIPRPSPRVPYRAQSQPHETKYPTQPLRITSTHAPHQTSTSCPPIPHKQSGGDEGAGHSARPTTTSRQTHLPLRSTRLLHPWRVRELHSLNHLSSRKQLR
jgi:hypothetical protein